MQMPRTAALLVVIASAALAQSSPARPLNLAVGAQKSLTLPGIQRVAIGDPAIADVKTIGNNELVLIGTSAGHTTLLVWKTGVSSPEHFEVTVVGPGSIAPPRPALREENTPGVSFSPTLQVGGKTMRATPLLERVAIGDPSIADLKTGNDMVVLEGLAPGRTNVLLWFSDGHREQWALLVVK